MAKVLKGDFGRAPKKSAANGKQDEAVPAYQLKLSLPFSDPSIWRRVRVPGELRLADLHRVIQVCMGWSDRDAHQFMVGKIFYQSGFGIENRQRKKEHDEARVRLHQLEESMPFIFTYLYDGGQGWEVEITLEAILAPGAAGAAPVLVAGECGCPPEDVGDIHHYQAILAGRDVSDDDGEPVVIDLGEAGAFTPALFDKEEISRRLETLTFVL